MNCDPLTTFKWNPTNGDEAFKVTLESHSVMSHLICSFMVTKEQSCRGGTVSEIGREIRKGLVHCKPLFTLYTFAILL